VPDAGFAFAGWGSDASGADNPLAVVMDADYTITAAFTNTLTGVAENLLVSGRPLGIYPNPSWVGGTHVVYRAPERGEVRLDVYDVTGRVVRRLLREASAAGGLRAITWDGKDEAGRDVAAGAYFVRMSVVAGPTSTQRFVLIR
jgi:FlgD Ig-like domain/Divergent InlB B-repeat domain